MKELVAAENRILGHSSLGESANLAVFAVPVMEFEEGGLHGANSRIVANMIANDPIVLEHCQVEQSAAPVTLGLSVWIMY